MCLILNRFLGKANDSERKKSSQFVSFSEVEDGEESEEGEDGEEQEERDEEEGAPEQDEETEEKDEKAEDLNGKLKARQVTGGQNSIFIAPDQDVFDSKQIPGQKPMTLKGEKAGEKYMQETLKKRIFQCICPCMRTVEEVEDSRTIVPPKEENQRNESEEKSTEPQNLEQTALDDKEALLEEEGEEEAPEEDKEQDGEALTGEFDKG